MGGAGRPVDRKRTQVELTSERIDFDLAALRLSLDRHDASIVIFEEAIEKERAFKDRTLEIIEELEAKGVREARTLTLLPSRESPDGLPK